MHSSIISDILYCYKLSNALAIENKLLPQKTCTYCQDYTATVHQGNESKCLPTADASKDRLHVSWAKAGGLEIWFWWGNWKGCRWGGGGGGGGVCERGKG